MSVIDFDSFNFNDFDAIDKFRESMAEIYQMILEACEDPELEAEEVLEEFLEEEALFKIMAQRAGYSWK